MNQEPHVSTSLEALQVEASRLSPTDRSRLLEHLIASLEVDEAVEAAWEAVADEREVDFESGKVHPVAFEDAIARLEARFPG
jgi:putative addiction module component (TIGR02574 family)